jgi:hypothetical protein
VRTIRQCRADGRSSPGPPQSHPFPVFSRSSLDLTPPSGLPLFPAPALVAIRHRRGRSPCFPLDCLRESAADPRRPRTRHAAFSPLFSSGRAVLSAVLLGSRVVLLFPTKRCGVGHGAPREFGEMAGRPAFPLGRGRALCTSPRAMAVGGGSAGGMWVGSRDRDPLN